MERLTGRCADGTAAPIKSLRATSDLEILDRLAAVEDILGNEYDLDHLRYLVQAENDGLLVVSPCKVGDTVYAAETAPVIPLTVDCVGVWLRGTDGEDWESLKNFGKTVFLSHEAAEAALARNRAIGG